MTPEPTPPDCSLTLGDLVEQIALACIERFDLAFGMHLQTISDSETAASELEALEAKDKSLVQKIALLKKVLNTKGGM